MKIKFLLIFGIILISIPFVIMLYFTILSFIPIENQTIHTGELDECWYAGDGEDNLLPCTIDAKPGVWIVFFVLWPVVVLGAVMIVLFIALRRSFFRK